MTVCVELNSAVRSYCKGTDQAKFRQIMRVCRPYTLDDPQCERLLTAAAKSRNLEDIVRMRRWGLDRMRVTGDTVLRVLQLVLNDGGENNHLIAPIMSELCVEWGFRNLRKYGLSRRALRTALRLGSTEMLENLRTGWHIHPFELRECGISNPAAYAALHCSAGLLMELHEGWGIGASALDDLALRVANRLGAGDVARILVEKCGVTPTDRSDVTDEDSKSDPWLVAHVLDIAVPLEAPSASGSDPSSFA